MASHPRQALRLVALSILTAAGAALADPVAFVVNADSNSVSVVDVTRETTRENLLVWDGGSPNATREPKDALVDPRSGRLFVASRERLVSFDGRMADGRGRSEVAAQDEGSGLALDETGRRIFMSHEQLGNYPNGVVSEFSIANPAAPVLVAEHEIAGIPDLRFIAWDPKYRRLYVVDDDGAIARTGKGDLSLAPVAGAGAPNPGGILVDPAGGIWVSSRVPGELVRITEAGARSGVAVPNGASQPRGLAWKSGQILVALEDIDKVRRFNPATAAWVDEMTTGDRPQDVGVTLAGQTVSANRQALDGSVSVAGRVIATTQEKSIALAVVEVARLTPDPSSHAFCWNVAGDTDEKTFSVQNTRIDRGSIDLGTLTRAGSNPGAYSVVSDGCSAARLKWGAACQFRLRFTASGTSVQPPPTFPIGGFQAPRWPATVGISSTDGTASAQISLQGLLNLRPCYGVVGPLRPLLPTGGL